MTTVSIISVKDDAGQALYHASAAGKQSVGASAGEALDSLTGQLSPDAAGTVVVIQQELPDEYFTADQQHRLESLMTEWRQARDRGETLPAERQRELDQLVEQELLGATARSQELLERLDGRRRK